MGRAAKGLSGRSDADVVSLRARSAVLFADGKSASEVAYMLGITERQARRYKADVAPVLREGAEATLDTIAQAASDIRERISTRGVEIVDMLADAALGRLPMISDDGLPIGYQRDASMVNAQVRAGLGLIGFIVGQKLDATVTPLSADTATQVTAIVKAKLAANG